MTNSTNYRAIRFSDVLLLAAEAYNATGNDSKAQEYVNRVRTRAGLSDLVTTAGSLEQDIQQERRLELAGEGHRFFDLVRTRLVSAESALIRAKYDFVFKTKVLQFYYGNLNLD